MTVSQKARATATSSCSLSDETSDTDEGSEESNTSDDDEDDNVDERLIVGLDPSPPMLDKPADDARHQVLH